MAGMKKEVRKALEAQGLNTEQIDKLRDDYGVTAPEHLSFITADDLVAIGVAKIPARTIVAAFSAPEADSANTSDSDDSDEIPEGKNPTPNQVNGYANQLGIDPSTLTTFMMFNAVGGGMGMDMDISGMLPIGQIVAGYNPRRRDMSYMVMGQIERRLGSPIVVINSDGSINTDLTAEHIQSLEDGFEAPEDNVYFDADGATYEIISVGVDAQGIYDADPLKPTTNLGKNQMGTGRIRWNGVSLDVRQMVYFAVQTGELDPGDGASVARLRDKISSDVKRTDLAIEFPAANSRYNEAARSGALPTLRVQLNRTRRKETMPRRRVRRDGGSRFGSDAGFPDERNEY